MPFPPTISRWEFCVTGDNCVYTQNRVKLFLHDDHGLLSRSNDENRLRQDTGTVFARNLKRMDRPGHIARNECHDVLTGELIGNLTASEYFFFVLQ